MENIKFVIEKSARIDKLIDELYAKMPEIESARGVLVTESYKATEALPIINRRSAGVCAYSAQYPHYHQGRGAYRG